MNTKLKNVNKETEEVIEETVKETEGEAMEPDKDKEPQPPAVTEEPKKGFFKKIGNGFKKVGSGIKNALDKEVKLWQVIAAPVLIAGVVIGAKRIYEKGQRDALGLPDEDDFQLPEEDIKALETTADTEEVIYVEDYEEPEVNEVTEELEDEEVYEDEEEFIEE